MGEKGTNFWRWRSLNKQFSIKVFVIQILKSENKCKYKNPPRFQLFVPNFEGKL